MIALIPLLSTALALLSDRATASPERFAGGARQETAFAIRERTLRELARIRAGCTFPPAIPGASSAFTIWATDHGFEAVTEPETDVVTVLGNDPIHGFSTSERQDLHEATQRIARQFPARDGHRASHAVGTVVSDQSPLGILCLRFDAPNAVTVCGDTVPGSGD